MRLFLLFYELNKPIVAAPQNYTATALKLSVKQTARRVGNVLFF